MGKRLFLTIAASLCLAGAYATLPTQYESGMAGDSVVAHEPNGQVLVESQAVSSGEVSTIEESKVTQEMIQAEGNVKNKRLSQKEKAENAKINDSWGGAITLIAMCIVLSALIVLSVLFFFFGKISSWTMSRKKLKAHGKSKHDAEDHHLELDSGDTIAAIAVALAQHFDTKAHDLEDTILTIQRMKRSYSPWNSKIYNLRRLPDVVHNLRK